MEMVHSWNSFYVMLKGIQWPVVIDLSNLLDAATAKVMALQKGLVLIEEIGCFVVIIETDCLELCHPYSAILADCFFKSSCLGSIRIQRCNREANSVTHKLAHYAYDSNSSCFLD